MLVLGDFTTADTLYVPFDTYDSAGASVTITGLAVTDIEIYKDGSTTQRASDNGYALLDTDGIDFDGSTGLHGFSVSLSDNSDAGFYAAGSQYWLHVNAITVDGQTVKFTCYFTIGRLLKPTTAGRTLDVSAGGEAGVDWANVGSPTTTVGLSNTTVGIVTDLANGAIDAATFAADVDAEILSYLVDDATRIDASQLNTHTAITAAGIADAVLDEDMTAHQTQGTFGQAIGDPTTGLSIIGRLPNAAAGAADGLFIVGTNVGTVIISGQFTVSQGVFFNDTFDVVGNTTFTGSVSATNALNDIRGVQVNDFTTAAKALLQTEANDALVANRLDELLAADSDINGAAPPTVGSVFHELMSKTAGSFTFDQTTDSLEALRDRGDAAWITATGFSTHSAADVWTVATRVLTAATNITSTGGTTVPQTGDSFARLGAPAGASVSADVAAVKSDTAAILLDTGTDGVVVAAASKTGYALTSSERDSIAAALLDLSNGIETGVTPRQALRAVAAICAGIVSGAGTGTEVFKAIAAASGGTTRVTVTVDEDGNRSALTLNL